VLYGNSVPKKRGLYASSGVAQGGQVPKMTHMGATTAARAGGANTKGSARGFATLRKRVRATPQPSSTRHTQSGYHAPATQHAAPRTQVSNPGLGQLPALDYRNAPSYQPSMAQAIFNRDTGLADIEATRNSYAPKYALGLAGINDWNRQDTENGEAALAGAGFFRSGTRETEFGNRERTRIGRVAELDDTYGQGALDRLARDTASVNGQYGLDSGNAEADARDWYNNQPAPDMPIPRPGVDILAGYGGPKGFFRRKGGGWRFINQNGYYHNVSAIPKGARVIKNPLPAPVKKKGKK
jgi:hypothetical protein